MARFKGFKKELKAIADAKAAEERRYGSPFSLHLLPFVADLHSREREAAERKKILLKEREKEMKELEKQRQELIKQGVIGPKDPWPPCVSRPTPSFFRSHPLQET